MQIMYVLVFLVSLIVVASTTTRDNEALSASAGESVAGHMAIWHRAAVGACEGGCPGGVVDVRPSLHPHVASAPAFASARFTSRYDNVNNVLVTYMNAGYRGAMDGGFGTVAAGLQYAGKGESSHMGVWDASARAVMFSRPPPNSQRSMPLASPFMGGTIPDGSPVMVSRP